MRGDEGKERGVDKRGERAALYAGIGVAAGMVLGVGVGAVLGGSSWIITIALLGILGAVVGMGVGYLYRSGNSEE